MRHWHGFFSHAFRSSESDRRSAARGGCGDRSSSLFRQGVWADLRRASTTPRKLRAVERDLKTGCIPTMIHSGDVLHPPEALAALPSSLQLWSAEHFSPTASIINALAAFLQTAATNNCCSQHARVLGALRIWLTRLCTASTSRVGRRSSLMHTDRVAYWYSAPNTS